MRAILQKLLPALMSLLMSAYAQEANGEYRDFTGANGVVIQAVLLDKTEDSVVLLVKNGTRTTVPLANLSEEDREFVKSWTKEMSVFVQKCRSLSIRQLLELRGYEAFAIRLENNSIMVDGKLNGKPARFLIDTGAGTSLIHDAFAKEAGCEVGPMDEIIYGVAGEAKAGWAEVDTFQLGESVFTKRRILATDLMNGKPEGAKLKMEAILGGEFLSTLDAVIAYKDRLMFLRSDLSDGNEVEVERGAEDQGQSSLQYRLFKTKDGQVLRGVVLSKNTVSVKLRLHDGQDLTLAHSRLVPEDAEYVSWWSEAGDIFQRYCGGLSIEDLLTLRKYQSFEYERRGNHIFVDGTLNKHEVTYMIDTGASTSLLHTWAAEEYECEVGPMDQEVFGIGGTAPAAVTRIAELTMGDAVITNRKVLATDLARFQDDDQLGFAGVFGADFMRELDAVITYRENRIFLIQR